VEVVEGLAVPVSVFVGVSPEVGVCVTYGLGVPDDVGVEPLDREFVGVGVEKDVTVAVLAPVPEPVVNGLIVAVVDPDVLPV
jgi:hypothetical protein